MKNHQCLEVDLVHVREFNDKLGDALEDKPAEYLPLVGASGSFCAYGICTDMKPVLQRSSSVCQRADASISAPSPHHTFATKQLISGQSLVQAECAEHMWASRYIAGFTSLCCVQFERACKEVLKEDHQLTSEGEEQEFDDVQLLLYSSQQFGPSSMRQLTSSRVSKLVQLSGIITSASKPKVRHASCWQQ